MIYFLAILLAFCSVCYELLLGQVLSAFLGNTVLRYSVTIGLYMASMGVGAFLVQARIRTAPLVSLLFTELGLTIFGAGSVPLLFAIDYLGAPLWGVSLLAHLFIVVIGILTGLEIPLLVELRRKQKSDDEGVVIGVDYFGAFLGTLVFAFYLYPHAGLVESAFALASLNAVAGLMLIMLEDRVRDGSQRMFQRLVSVQAILFLLVAYCWIESASITSILLEMYLPVI